MQERVLQEGMPEHIRAVLGTVRLALDDLRREGSVYVEAGLQLLGMLTMCPPVGVSWSLFVGRGLKPAVAAVCSELQNEDGLCAVALHLQQYTGLVQVDVGQRLFGMHVLVQDAVFAELSSAPCVPLAAFAAEEDNALQVMNWLEGSGAAGAPIVSLMERVCCHKQEKAFLPLYTDAASTCAQVLSVIEKRQADRGFALTSESLKPLGRMREWTARCLPWIGRQQEALGLRKRLVGDAVRLLPPDDEFTATSMLYLAMSYSALGLHHEALQLQKDSLAMRQRILPEEHEHIARCMNNLAGSYSALGMHHEAIRLRKDTLAMLQMILPEDHENIAASMNNLAGSYSALGLHHEALQLNKETLAMRQRILSEEHEGIATSMNNLAQSYHALGMHREAIRLRKETLAMLKRILPEEHEHIATIVGYLAESYHALGMHREALQLNKDTLAMRQRILPKEHEHIAASMNNLAGSYSALGMHREALQLKLASFKASFRSISESHSNHWGRVCNLTLELFTSPGQQPLACDLMFRLLCLVSAADDRVLVRSRLLEFALRGMPLGLFVTNGRALDILHFLPLLLDLDASLAAAAAQGHDFAVIARCMLLRSVAEACKLGGRYQQALHTLRILDDLTSPQIARCVQAQNSSNSGDLGLSAAELQQQLVALAPLCPLLHGAAGCGPTHTGGTDRMVRWCVGRNGLGKGCLIQGSHSLSLRPCQS
jgi:tetratricopeptide (TPR) repeat protein